MTGQSNEALVAADWLATQWPSLAIGAVKILVIVVLAMVIRTITHRMIDRLTSGEAPKVLQPLKDKALQLPAPLRSERRKQRAKTIGSVLKSVSTTLIYGLASFMVLGQLGIDLTIFIASAGAIGLAVGFGAQSLIKDFFSGIFMMLEDQYGVGDVVDAGQASGTVEAVSLRVTKLRDVNGTLWYIRNGEITRIGNSSQGFAVAVVDLPLAHSGSVDRALDVLGTVANSVTAKAPLADDVLESPQVLGVEKVTPEGITLRLTVKVRPGRQWAIQRALRAKIMAALHKEGIEPPAPVKASSASKDPKAPAPLAAQPHGDTGDEPKELDLST